MELLLGSLAARRPDAPPSRVTMPTHLVLRRSTGAVNTAVNTADSTADAVVERG